MAEVDSGLPGHLSRAAPKAEKPVVSWLEPRPFYLRITIIGLLVISLSALISGVRDVVLEEFGNPFVYLLLVVPLIAAPVIWRFGVYRIWPLIVAAFLGLMALSIVLPVAAFFLAQFNSFFDFSYTLMLLTGSLITLVGAIVNFRQVRRDAFRFRATAVESWTLIAVLAIVAVFSVLSGTLTVTSTKTVDAASKANALVIVIKDRVFEPSVPPELLLKAGEPHQLLIKNEEPVVHTFVIEEFGIEVTLGPGSEILVQVPASTSPGDAAPFKCGVRGHAPDVTPEGQRSERGFLRFS